MDATSYGLPVVSGRTLLGLKSSILAYIVGNVLCVTAVIGLLAVSFSTASHAETVPAVTETAIPQLKVQYAPYPVFTSLAAIQAAYPPGETNVWVYQLSNYDGYDKAFYTDVQPLPGCGNCYTEPLGYTWVGQFVQISPYCLYGNGDIVAPVGYTSGGSLGDPICPSRLTCPASYTLTGDGMCWRPDPCPVTELTPIPSTDNCAITLERYNSTQAEKDAACGTLTTDMQTAVACFRNKLANVNNPTTDQPIPLVITAGIRNIEYQRHLREIWDKMEQLVDLTRNNSSLTAACATRRAELAAEKGCDNAGPCAPCSQPTATARNHCFDSRPALPDQNTAMHTQGRAIDADRVQTVDPLQNALNLRTPPQTIQVFLDAPTNCNLRWGGLFTPIDRVHFELR